MIEICAAVLIALGVFGCGIAIGTALEEASKRISSAITSAGFEIRVLSK